MLKEVSCSRDTIQIDFSSTKSLFGKVSHLIRVLNKKTDIILHEQEVRDEKQFDFTNPLCVAEIMCSNPKEIQVESQKPINVFKYQIQL